MGELQAQLSIKDIELQSEVKRTEVLSKTINDLREELQKKGIGRSLDERLRALGLVGTSSADVGSTSASELINRYGSCSGVH